MNLLLDTHTFLWWISGEPIPELAASAIRNEKNVVWFSAASAWEIAIKASIGKLRFPGRASQFIEQQRIVNRFNWLSIEISALDALAHLPLHHRDPFDRLLIAQAISLDYHLITADQAFASYDVKYFWA